MGMLLPTLMPDYAAAEQVSFNDEAIKENGAQYTMHLYPGTNHGFHNDSTGRYDEEQAELAWKRTLDFFRKEL